VWLMPGMFRTSPHEPRKPPFGSGAP